jgi:hypothetical protein
MNELTHASPLAALKCKCRPGNAAAERSSSRILVRVIICRDDSMAIAYFPFCPINQDEAT